MIRTERIDGDDLDYRPNRTELPCPDCGRHPVAVAFDYDLDGDDGTVCTLDERWFSICWVKKNLAYVHVEVESSAQIDGAGITCPSCGHEPSSRSDVESTGRGVHADQTTYICPECDEEEWEQGWSIAWSEKYGPKSGTFL